MGLFSSKKNYLGVDFGSSSIKVVELTNVGGRPKLVTYGFTEKNPANISDSGLIENVDEAASVLVEICKKAKVTSKKAITALPNYAVFTSVLTLPQMPKKELAQAIAWEAKKIIPASLEDVVLDWKIIEEIGELSEEEEQKAQDILKDTQKNLNLKRIYSKAKKNVRVLLTGAGKNVIKRYIDIFAKAGMGLLSLETESFALARSLVGNDKSNIMIIDLGATTSSICITEKGVPVVTRSLKSGGNIITKSISANMNITMEKAEQFKQDLALDLETSESILPSTVEKSFEPILNEIKYTLDFYQKSHNKKVEKIILTGGTAFMGHLTGYLSRVLSINTYVGDPWARIIYPTDLKPILDRLGARFAVAVGLAMRDIE